MLRKIIGGALLVGGTSLMALPIADATPPNPNHKDYVCKYVGKPGVDERLQTGNNPIWVDTAATEAGWFNDRHERSYVIVADTPRLDPEPSISQCPSTPPPTVTVTTTTPVKTTTTPVKTTTTTRPVVTKTALPPVVTKTTPPVRRQVVAPPAGGIEAGDGSTQNLASTGFDPVPLFVGIGMFLSGIATLVGRRLTVVRK